MITTTTTTTTVRSFKWGHLLRWLVVLTAFVMMGLVCAVIFIRFITCKHNTCSNKSCCTSEFIDVVAISLVNLISVIFIITIVLYEVIYESSISTNTVKWCAIYQLLCIPYLIEEAVGKYIDNYKDVHYEIRFINTWAFTVLVYLAIIVSGYILYGIKKLIYGIYKCIPNACCETHSYNTVSRVIVPINTVHIIAVTEAKQV